MTTVSSSSTLSTMASTMMLQARRALLLINWTETNRLSAISCLPVMKELFENFFSETDNLVNEGAPITRVGQLFLYDLVDLLSVLMK